MALFTDRLPVARIFADPVWYLLDLIGAPKDKERGVVRVGVQALIFNERNEVLLQLRSGERYGAGTWGLMGGLQEHGEEVKAALVREAREETGIEISDADLVVAVDTQEPQGTHHLQLGFRVRSFTGEPQIKEPHKSGGLRYFPLDQLPENMFGPSMAVLERYRQNLREA